MSLAWVPNICEMFTRSGKKKINNFLNSPKRLTLPNKFTKVRKIHFSRVFRKKEKSSIGHILLEKSKFPSVATTWNWCLTQRPLRLGQYASEADQFLVWLPASLDPLLKTYQMDQTSLKLEKGWILHFAHCVVHSLNDSVFSSISQIVFLSSHSPTSNASCK